MEVPGPMSEVCEVAAAPSGFFVLRTPLLPFDELAAWGDGLAAPGAVGDGERLAAALAADRARLRARLHTLVARPDVRDALRVASPDLDRGLAHWLGDPDGEKGRRVERALVRYVERMASRATPFGLFAGCSVGAIGRETDLALAPRASYSRHTRLDMGYVASLTGALARDPAVRGDLAYRPGSGLIRLAGRLRHFRSQADDARPTHRPVWLEPTPELERALARARDGATPGEIAAALIEAGMPAGEADAYVDGLIEREVLVSELEPAVTGPEPVAALAERLRRLPAAASVADRLEETVRTLAAIDADGVGIAPGRYAALAARLADLPGRLEPDRLLQVDLMKPAPEATLGEAVLAEIARGVELLRRLGRPARDGVARFREAFVARYEGCEVPLVRALDDEVGLGFGRSGDAGAETAAVLEGVRFPPPTDEQRVPWGPRHALLLGRLGDALARGADEVVLDQADLERMAAPEPQPLPHAFSATAILAAESAAALGRGEFRVLLQGVAGPSGARLLGRFCHADARLHRLVVEHLRQEEALRPDAVFAEVVHLPDGRTGNIICRPVLRDYEITCLGRSGAPPERQIPLDDLLVSVRGDRIVLRSARLGREVIPRLTSAQNYFHPRAIAIYRFLCALQGQRDARALGWDWGPLASAPFLPWVRSGRLVLARARWRVEKDELRALGAARGAGCYRAVQAWRRRRRLPRLVALADGDNELLVDLDNVLSVESFVHLVKGREEAILVEHFPGPDGLVARGPEGRFAHELSVPFVATRPPVAAAPDGAAMAHAFAEPHVPIAAPPLAAGAGDGPTRAADLPDRRTGPRGGRLFAPGSVWLYAKLYTPASSADGVLRDVVRPLVAEVLGSGAADGWFFIRYGDPDWHVRLRFRGSPERLHAEVLPRLQAAAAPLLEDERIWKVQLDTYEREVERYGGPVGVALAERLFQVDSEAVLAIVAASQEEDEADAGARWRLAVAGMDRLLADLGFDLGGRRSIVRGIREAYAAELRADAAVRRRLAERFRAERAALEALLDQVADEAGPLGSGLAALRRRSERLAPIAAELRAAERDGRLTAPLAALAPSYLHMHANRLLRSSPRAAELVLYELLARLYDSLAARGRPDAWRPADAS